MVVSILRRQVNSSSNFESLFIVMIHNSPVNFKLIHFLLWIKESHKSLNFETSECSGKTLPNSLRHLPNQKSVFLQILLHFSLSWNITPLYFFSSNIIYFVQKEPIKAQIFETFKCSGKNLSNFSFQFCNDSSSNVGSFFFAMAHNSSVLFWCETLYTLHKGTNQSGNFENFESSGQNFWNNKSVFLRILLHS